MGGSQTTRTEIPEWLQSAAQNNIARSNEVAQSGYVPYFGPDVAAFNPMQQAAFQNTANAASAFGLEAPSNAMAGMPDAQGYAGGVQGYSSAPMYQQSLEQLKTQMPGLYSQITGMFIDPVTGAGPRAPFDRVGMAPQARPAMLPSQAGYDASSGGNGMGGGNGVGSPVGSFRSSAAASYLPGGVNTANPASRFNQAAAVITSRPTTISASSRPMANPRRK